MNRTKFIGTALLISLCVTACGDGTNQATEEDKSAENKPVIQEVAILSDCASLTQTQFNDRGQANCAFVSDDDPRWRFEVRYGEPTTGEREEDISIAIDVIDDGGRIVMAIEETAQFTSGLPLLFDLDEDGRSELLVPLMTGNVNTVYAVWQGKIDEPPYIRVGEVSGVAFQTHQDGLFSVAARSSAVSWVITYFKMTEGQLAPIATTSIELPDAEDDIETCTITDNGGLELVGLTLEQARTQFCDAG